MTSSDTPDTHPATPPPVHKLYQMVREDFPEYWPAIDAGLAVYGSLLLADLANPTALIYVGPSGSGKTTIVNILGSAPLSYRSDQFTPAAFVSHAAPRTEAQLAKIDLLPRIRDKVLVTPELAPMFRGKREELENSFRMLTRVLDGQGLTRDSGVHGQRGYVGKYLFGWLGATTPFTPALWGVMAHLGTRLFFFAMDDAKDRDEPNYIGELASIVVGTSYEACVTRCQQAASDFLTTLFEPGVRSVEWPKAESKGTRGWMAFFAELLATGRSRPEEPEDPKRAMTVLWNIARGHALVYGRRAVAPEDLAVACRVAVMSMPPDARRLFLALVRYAPQPITVTQAQAALGVGSHHTAKAAMEAFETRGIGVMADSPDRLGFAPEFEWCAYPLIGDLLLSPWPSPASAAMGDA
jgi:hypothetical protein